MDETQVEQLILKKLDEWLPKTLTISSLTQEIERRYRLSQRDLYDQSTETQRLQSLITDIQSRLSSTQNEVRRLRVKVEEINVSLNYKVYRDELKSVEAQIKGLCPLRIVESLQEEVRGLAKEEEIKKFVEKQVSLEKTMFSTFFNKSEAAENFHKMRGDFMDLFIKYATKDDLQGKVFNLTKKDAEAKREIEELRLNVMSINEKYKEAVDSLKLSIDKKAGLKDIEGVYSKIQALASSESLHELSITLNLLINSCKKNIERIDSSLLVQDVVNSQVKETLTDKANCTDIEDLNSKLDKVFKHVDLEDKIEDMVNSLQYYTQKSEIIFTEQIDLRESMNKMIAFYEKKIDHEIEVQTMQSNISSLQIDTSNKIDREEVIKFLDNKTNTRDYDSLFKFVEQIDKHIKLTVSQIEVMQKVMADPLKARGLERLQREYLSKVTQKLVEMIICPKKEYPDSKRLLDVSILPRSRTQTPGRALTAKSNHRIN